MPHNPCSVLMKVGVDSTGHAPSKRILDDNMLIPNIQAATVREKPSLVVSTSANGVKCEAEPDVSVSTLPSSLRKEHLLPQLPQRPTSTDTFPEPEEIHVISANSNGRISPSLVKGATGLSNSVFKDALLNSINLNSNGAANSRFEEAMKGDGTDYKRKCLKSSSINIQSLNLTRRDTNDEEAGRGAGSSGSNGGTPPDGKKRSSKGDKDKSDKLLTSPRSFMRAVSNKLSEITQFGSKDDKDKNCRTALKHRSLSVSSGLGESGGTKTPPSGKQARPSSTGVKSAPSSGTTEDIKSEPTATKAMHRRSTSLSGSTYFFPAVVGAKSPESAAQATAVATSHVTTPRPQSLNVQDKTATPPGPSSGPPSAPITPPSGSRSPELHLGIAEMRADNEDGLVLDAVVRGTAQNLNDSANVDGPSTGGLSTSSSCSNMSQASTVITNPADSSTSAPSTARSNSDNAINKRKKYAALLFHYPNLQPCLSDPALKVVAKKLNKCLKFKDELQRSLVKAETVQETETVRSAQKCTIYFLRC